MSKILKWLDNYWYHYKWQTIVGGLFLIFLIISVTQCAMKTDADITLLYGGPAALTANDTRDLTNVFNLIMPKDFNGDGKKSSELINIYLLTNEQLDQLQQEAKANNDILLYNSKELSNNRTQFSTQIFAGEAVIVLIDPQWYTDIRDSGGFVKLTDVLGYQPEYAQDAYSVQLHDTDFAKYFEIFSVLPEDTLIAVRGPSTSVGFKSKTNEEKRYQNQLEMFRAIMNFSIPAGNTESADTLTAPNPEQAE